MGILARSLGKIRVSTMGNDVTVKVRCRKAGVFEIAAHSNSMPYLERNREIDSQLVRLATQVIRNS
jgi:hypothetical protein